MKLDLTRQHSTEPAARLIDEIGARLNAGEPIRIQTVTTTRQRQRVCRRCVEVEEQAFGTVHL